jgi:hypothetical protein
MQQRLPREVLAAAVADLEDEPLGIGKRGAEIDRQRELEPRQVLAIGLALRAMKPLAGAAAEERARFAAGIERMGFWQPRPPSPPP